MGEFPNRATQFSKDRQPEIPGGTFKKGSKHISTHIQEMLNDPDFELKLKDGKILKGAPLQAILKTAVVKAVSGDMRAFDMLCKYGYGEKLNVDMSGELVNISVVEFIGGKTGKDKNQDTVS